MALLQVKPDIFSHTSDNFPLMLELAEKLIKEGKAYGDDTPAEEMKKLREQKLPSKNRDNCKLKSTIINWLHVGSSHD